MPSDIIQVAAGLVFHAGQLLITRRRLHDHLGGLWEFPGGKLEPGESFATCLVRELHEELGIAVRVGEELDDVTHSYPEKTVRVKFFRCELLDGVAHPIHCHALAWIGPSQLTQYEFPAADAKLLQLLRENPKIWAAPNFS